MSGRNRWSMQFVANVSARGRAVVPGGRGRGSVACRAAGVTGVLLGVTGVLLGGTAAAQTDTLVRGGAEGTVADAGPTISPAEAAAHDGKECTVELTVRSARHLEDKGMCFLNSAKQHRDDDNFTVVIFRKGLEQLREAGIDSPADHYLDRTIRVRGVVQLRNEKPQIVVEAPAQVELVEEPDGEADGEPASRD